MYLYFYIVDIYTVKGSVSRSPCSFNTMGYPAMKSFSQSSHVLKINLLCGCLDILSVSQPAGKPAIMTSVGHWKPAALVFMLMESELASGACLLSPPSVCRLCVRIIKVLMEVGQLGQVHPGQTISDIECHLVAGPGRGLACK